MGGGSTSYRLHHSQLQNILSGRKVQFLDQKYFLKNCRKKERGFSYRIHQFQFHNISRNRKIQFFIQKYFLQKMLTKKRGGGYFVQNSLLIQQNLRIKLHFLIPKYVWGQKCCNKREGILYRIQPSQFEIIPEIEKYDSSFQKIFPTKNDGQKKGGGISYRIHYYSNKMYV